MATLKDLLPQIPQDELAILRDLNSKLDESNLTEATIKETAQAVKEIIQNWKDWSKYTLAAMLLIPNIANALETYSPKTLDAIRTEVPTETSTKSITPAPIPGEIKSFNFDENFESGKTSLTNKENLVKTINDIENWIKGKKLNNFKIVITAGESQVTNPKGFEKPKSLALARAQVVEDLVSNLGFNKIEINTKQGTTRYKSGVDNPDDPKYKAEQFVTVSIVVENSVCSMQPIIGKGSQGEAGKGYVTSTEYLSGKGNLEMNTGTIPDRMVILDANGKITHDTGYIATKKKPGQWTYTPAYVLALTKASIAKSPAMADAKLEVTQPLKGNTVKEKLNHLISQLANTPNPSKMGDEIYPALVEMEKMIEKGVTEFVLYKVEDNISAKINFDENQGDVQMKVYSPIGSTGYDIKGICK